MKQIFKRSKKNPILKPNKNNAWESLKVYNPGVIYHKNKYHLFYRAVGKNGVSSIVRSLSTGDAVIATAITDLSNILDLT